MFLPPSRRHARRLAPSGCVSNLSSMDWVQRCTPPTITGIACCPALEHRSGSLGSVVYLIYPYVGDKGCLPVKPAARSRSCNRQQLPIPTKSPMESSAPKTTKAFPTATTGAGDTPTGHTHAIQEPNPSLWRHRNSSTSSTPRAMRSAQTQEAVFGTMDQLLQSTPMLMPSIMACQFRLRRRTRGSTEKHDQRQLELQEQKLISLAQSCKTIQPPQSISCGRLIFLFQKSVWDSIAELCCTTAIMPRT